MARSTHRPRVIVNMAMSLDGRITTRRREHIALGSRHDRYLMDVLRARADAVVIGSGTLRHDGYPVLVRDADLRRRRLRRRGSAHPLNVVLSRTLELPLRRAFFAHPDTERLVVTTRRAPAERARRVARRAEVVRLRTTRLDPAGVLELLAGRGVRNVVLEGGGEIHWAFQEAGVVDEIYVTLTPRLIGGRGAPTLLDGRGFLAADHRRLELVSCRRRDSELFLRYRVTARRGP